MAKSRGRKFAEITSPTSGVFDLTSVPTITNAKLQNSAMTLAGSSVSLGGTGVANTDALSEGSSNLYFTNTRADSRADVRIAAHNLLARAGGTMTGNLTLGDNVNAYFGASTDLRIYHDGTNSHIINSTGELRVTGSNIAIKSDSAKLYFGASDDLQIYHDGSHSFISDQGTGHLKLLAGDFRLNNAADNAQMISAVSGGSVYLYDNNSVKLQTTSSGVTVTGTLNGISTTKSASGNRWGILPEVEGNGVMEIGRYIDFHVTDGDTSDYGARFDFDGSKMILTSNFEGAGTIRGTRLGGNVASNSNYAINTLQNGSMTHAGYFQANGDDIGIEINATAGSYSSNVLYVRQSSLTTGGNLARFANSAGDKVVITTAGDVGIGTASITNPYSQTPHTDLNIDGTWGGVISFKLGGTLKGWVGQRSSGNEDMVLGAASGQHLLFYTNGTNERMRIASDGKLTLGPNQQDIQIAPASTNSGTNSIYLRGNASGEKSQIILNHFGYADYYIGTGLVGNGVFTVGTGNTDARIAVDNSGTVYINPNAILQSANESLKIDGPIFKNAIGSNNTTGVYETFFSATFTPNQTRYIRINIDGNLFGSIQITMTGNYSNVNAIGSVSRVYGVGYNAINTSNYANDTAGVSIWDRGYTSSKFNFGNQYKPNNTTGYIPITSTEGTYNIDTHITIRMEGSLAGLTSIDIV